jgi:hypothetical protein
MEEYAQPIFSSETGVRARGYSFRADDSLFEEFVRMRLGDLMATGSSSPEEDFWKAAGEHYALDLTKTGSVMLAPIGVVDDIEKARDVVARIHRMMLQE